MSATQGITKSCPLSPLLGAIYLSPLDEALENFAKKDQAIYVHFMDDWVLLCKTRHQLRNAVKTMNVVLNKLKVTKHTFKTFIGRMIKGFDFLGNRLNTSVNVLHIAWMTWVNHKNKVAQLYEQGADLLSIERYVKRWLTWVKGGLRFDVELADRLFLEASGAGFLLRK
ncbi:reverse transcriptase domain-containing protein [Zooshikella ganghwensis]|uniref:reverse transcriptase domain-containing protein n=1 Tax=Zooshikella ganghwensis TaxID=202772 RepID=UPI000481CCD6|nr:reverse transcriptase domain-containing protein [Zooshikella ganghwensis]